MRKIIITLFCLTLLVACGSSQSLGKQSLVNKTWIASDESVLKLEKDQSYKWAMDKESMEDNVYLGEYKLFFGKEALSYMKDVLSKEFDMNYVEFEEYLENGEPYYKKENFMILSLDRKSGIINGEESEDVYLTHYFGFYLTNEKETVLDLANMTTKSYATFRLEE